MKAVTPVKSALEAEARNSLEIDYEKAAAEAINKVKQDLATKEIEQRLKQEIDSQKLNETLCRPVEIVTLFKIGDKKTIRHNKNWSQDNVDNHCGRP